MNFGSRCFERRNLDRSEERKGAVCGGVELARARSLRPKEEKCASVDDSETGEAD